VQSKRKRKVKRRAKRRKRRRRKVSNCQVISRLKI
jgi:hypothetical protein|tara:strand:- start:84 stop:188 length:105 start_codon:yes stop_codon:yes gene_type:complete